MDVIAAPRRECPPDAFSSRPRDGTPLNSLAADILEAAAPTRLHWLNVYATIRYSPDSSIKCWKIGDCYRLIQSDRRMPPDEVADYNRDTTQESGTVRLTTHSDGSVTGDAWIADLDAAGMKAWWKAQCTRWSAELESEAISKLSITGSKALLPRGNLGSLVFSDREEHVNCAEVWKEVEPLVDLLPHLN